MSKTDSQEYSLLQLGVIRSWQQERSHIWNCQNFDGVCKRQWSGQQKVVYKVDQDASTIPADASVASNICW